MKISSSKNNFQFSDNEYGYIGLSANQTTGIADTNPIKFNTLLAGNITFNPATYQVTLKKNRTYRLSANFYIAFTGNTGVVSLQFYNVTASAVMGEISINFAVTNASHKNENPTAFHIITPTVDTVVECRIKSPTALQTIYSGYSYWEIQQINIVSPVIQDPSRVYAYVSPQITLSVTGVGVTSFVVVRATGTFYKTSDGKWHLRFNIHATHDNDASFYYRIDGIVGIYGFRQACAFSQATTGSAVYEWCYLDGNSGDISIATASVVGNTQVSGDVELASKPTGYAIPSDV